MKLTIHKIFIILFIYSSLYLLTACMSDDRSSCPQVENVYLKFQFPLSGTLTDQISSVDVYLFNEEYELQGHYEVTRGNLEEFEGVRMCLEEGLYNVVCWANIIRCEILSYGALQTTELHHSYYPQDRPAFYAPFQTHPNTEEYEFFTFRVAENGKTEDQISFMSSHKEITISVSGYKDQDDKLPIVELTHLPVGYNFLFSPLSERVSYRIETRNINRGPLEASMTLYTPFFVADEEIGLTLYRGSDNQVITHHNLQALLQSKGVEPGYNDPIHIHFGFFSGNMEITLPGWDIEEIE